MRGEVNQPLLRITSNILCTKLFNIRGKKRLELRKTHFCVKFYYKKSTYFDLTHLKLIFSFTGYETVGRLWYSLLPSISGKICS